MDTQRPEDWNERSFPSAILVGSDLSEASDRVIREAAEIASRGGAELHVVSAYRSSVFGIRPGDREPSGEVSAEIKTALPAQLVRVLSPERLPVSMEVRIGDPAAILLQRAEEIGADAIVMGGHRGRDVHAQFLGTTADEVLRRARIPCLTLRNGLSLPLRRVAVAVDLSAGSGRILRTAVDWALWLSGVPDASETSHLQVVHVSPPGYGGQGRDAERSREDRAEAEMDSLLEGIRERLSGSAPFRLESEILREADVSGGLLRWLSRSHIDLLVLGTVGESGSGRARLGSVASALTLRANCPVLIVPEVEDGQIRSD